ncbi:MAG: hypothetical protein KJN90_01800 [Gammaproteobacteria bacterium]|nr:hypothetical protein [Gammaproteobacteria bacterium]
MGQQKSYLLQGRTFYVRQKGKSQDPLFIDDACYGYYLKRLLNSLRAARQQLHTFVLLPHEVRLLSSPYSTNGLLRSMQRAAIDYGEYFANRFSSICPLLTGQPDLHQVERDSQVLEYQKSIELAPVREQLVNMPGEYPWSAYPINAFGGHRNPIFMHRQYRTVFFRGNHPFQRYRDFVATTSSTGSSRPEL